MSILFYVDLGDVGKGLVAFAYFEKKLSGCVYDELDHQLIL